MPDFVGIGKAVRNSMSFFGSKVLFYFLIFLSISYDNLGTGTRA